MSDQTTSITPMSNRIFSEILKTAKEKYPEVEVVAYPFKDLSAIPPRELRAIEKGDLSSLGEPTCPKSPDDWVMVALKSTNARRIAELVTEIDRICEERIYGWE